MSNRGEQSMSTKKDDRPMCCERTYDPDGSIGCRHKPCKARAKVERDGKHYCGRHDPEARRAKNEEKRKQWKEEAAEHRKAAERRALEILACRGLSDDELRAMIAAREKADGSNKAS